LPAVDLGTGRSATAISAGAYYTCALLDDKSVKCWGRNHYGQSGVYTSQRGDDSGEMGDNLPAVDFGTGRFATAISASDFHTCALLDDKSVTCWGLNLEGQLGFGDRRSRVSTGGYKYDRVDLGTGRSATAISAGRFHTCALLDDKSVKCWGYNNNGQLGLGDTNQRGDASGEMGDDLPAVDLGTGRFATAISAGALHTCALLDDKSVKCWGSNMYGELGLGDKRTRGDASGEMGDNLPAVDLGPDHVATAISAGFHHTCALLFDKSVKCWGSKSLYYRPTRTRR
jgi:alpha-tubulin suppressor-like RCC1 family protein